MEGKIVTRYVPPGKQFTVNWPFPKENVMEEKPNDVEEFVAPNPGTTNDSPGQDPPEVPEVVDLTDEAPDPDDPDYAGNPAAPSYGNEPLVDADTYGA